MPAIATSCAADRDQTLVQVQNRALWLAVQMVHYANKTRTVEGVKAGGHMASSASTVTILTYLFFEYLRADDKIAVKPHASPIYHALQFLLSRDYNRIRAARKTRIARISPPARWALVQARRISQR